MNLSAVCSAIVLTDAMDASVSSGAGDQSVGKVPFSSLKFEIVRVIGVVRAMLDP